MGKHKSSRRRRSSFLSFDDTKSLLLIIFVLVGLLGTLAVLNKSTELREEAASTPLAFPGAVGFGAKTPGGRGGNIILVTNTNNDGEGSLRAALEATGKRMVIIKTSGTIKLNGPISIKSPFVSVYGNKAPGAGLQVRDGMVNIKTHDVILRYLKVRAGDEGPNDFGDRDAVTTTCGTGGQNDFPYNLIIDHSSLVWGTDIGGFAATCAAHDVTLQYNIMGEGIRAGGHPDNPQNHSKGMNLSNDKQSGVTKNFTIYKNVITTSLARMPQIRDAGRTDFINNVIYNWGDTAGEGSSTGMNMLGNTWKKGKASKTDCAFRSNPYDPATNKPVYINDEDLDQGMTQFCGGISTKADPYTPMLEASYVKSAQTAYDELINQKKVGATLPKLDSVDNRLISNVSTGQGVIIDSPNDVGGWPNLSGGFPYTDTDKDGMSDDFEKQYGFSPSNAADGFTDADGDGYLNVEEFLNDTDPKIRNDGNKTGSPSPSVRMSPTPTALIRPSPTPTQTPKPSLKPTPTSIPNPSPTPKPTPTPTPQLKTLRVNPNHDSFTDKDKPNDNFGVSTVLTVDNSPTRFIWMKFKIDSMPTQIKSAKVRMYNSNSSSKGGDMFYTSVDGWKENEITWKTQPTIDGSKLDTVKDVHNGNWYAWDVSNVVKSSENLYTFVVKTDVNNNAEYFSKDAKGSFPELVIDYY